MKQAFKIKKSLLIFSLLLCSVIGLTQQSIAQTVTGTVTSAETGEPLPGVNIIVKGTTTGAITDANGEYSLEVPSLEETLIFSFVGYQKQEIPIEGRTNINVSLTELTEELEEVVVIGYGTAKKSDLTGSIGSVSQEDITKTPSPTLGQAIQGRTSGIMVTHSGGAGGGVNMRIRGIGSITNEPDPLYVVDGVVGANINNIAPQNIESIQVLKDASSTAIYGADGANGVVIVTTKRGESGETKVSFSAYGSINEVPKQFNLMNADQYSEFYQEVLEANNEDPPLAYTDDFRQHYYGDGWQTGTNWQEEILQDAYTQNYYLSVSGGGENSNYLISARYYNELGVLQDDAAENFSIRANSDFEIGDYIKVGESIQINRRIHQNSSSGAFSMALESSPLMKVYNEDNKEGYEGAQIPVGYVNPEGDSTQVLNTGGNDKFNPLGMIDIPTNYDYRNNVTANLYAEIQPFDWLTFRTEPAVQGSFNRDRIWTPEYDMGVRGTNAATLDHDFSEGLSLSIKNQLTIEESFSNHNIVFDAVHHGRKGWSNNSAINGIGFNYEQLNVITQANDITAQGGYWPWGRLSYLGRLRYNYDSKYFLTASIRRDGSSNFGPERRWGTFPSVSAAWNLNQDLLPTVDQINMLKLRVGWGQTGNSDIGSFNYQTPLANPGEFHPVIGNQVVPALNEFRTIGNPFIKWESADMTNIGMDLNALNNKIQFTAEYFIKRQDDLLFQIPISGALGRQDGEPWMNIGKLRNQGFEFDLTYQNMEGVFNYRLKGNFSRVRNKVVSIPESIIGGNHITKEGHTVGSFYGYVAEGIIQEDDFDEEGNYKYAIPAEGEPAPGDLRFKDLNRDGKITDNDRTIIGKAIPDFNYSFTVDLFYQNFDLSLFMFGMQNYQVYNNQRSQIESFQSQDMDHNKSLDWAQNYYTEEDPSTKYLRADLNNTNQNDRISTWWVEDASFLRVQDLQIGYTLPKSALSYVGLSNARIYVSVKNLYTFTGYKGRDPESPINSNDPLNPGVDNNAYPLPRVYTAGINIDF
jgi:TonB-linked SusC/RagA family outer membrane protein